MTSYSKLRDGPIKFPDPSPTKSGIKVLPKNGLE